MTGGPRRSKRDPRVWGYAPAAPAAPARPVAPVRKKRPLFADVAAWIAATIIAISLMWLLAAHNLLIALVVVLFYGGFSWLLWSTRR